jgi:hypothetical protein
VLRSQMPETGKPVVERKAGNQPSEALTERSLQLRIRQQEILAELGVSALQGTGIMGLFNQVVRLTADALEAEYCKVLEYLPAKSLARARGRWLGRGCSRFRNRRG